MKNVKVKTNFNVHCNDFLDIFVSPFNFHASKIVSRYYKEDKDVKEDVELQAYLNELSLDGTGPNGGIGRVNMKHSQAY